MKTDNTEKWVEIILGLIFLPIAFIATFWTTYILWDVCRFFEISYVLNLGYTQLFGILLIIRFFKVLWDKSKKELGIAETIGKWFETQIGYLFFWGSAYLFHWILTKF